MPERNERQSSADRRDQGQLEGEDFNEPALHQVVASEAVLLLTVMVCTVMIWNNNVNVYGISYFGVTTPTLPIVAIGFLAGSVILIMASRKFPDVPPYGLVKWTLRIVSVGILLLLLTPYTLDTFFNWTHMILGASIFIVELYTGGVLCFRHLHDRLSKYALIIQFMGGVLAALSLPDNMLNFMLEGEVIFQIGFMVLLNHLLRTEPSLVTSALPPQPEG